MSQIFCWVLRVSSVLLITEILFNIKKYLKNRQKVIESKDSSVVSMALFFPDYSLCCPFVYREDYHSKPLSFEAPGVCCSRYNCKFVHFSNDTKRTSPLRQMVKVLSSAKHSVDISLWVFSVQLLANVCILLHRNNVVVRVVVDSREDETQNTQISALRKAGIAVRYAPQLVNSGMFHHKFAVVDNKVLITGSLNWTLSAIRKSCENVCITSRRPLVEAYGKRFHYYFNTFSESPTNVRRVPTIGSQMH